MIGWRILLERGMYLKKRSNGNSRTKNVSEEQSIISEFEL